MPIYHKWKCVFVHIPKTAGTSIHSKLHNKTDEHDDHYTFFELLNAHDAELFESYLSFSVVRNPYDRFISSFEFCRTVINEIEHDTSFESFVQKADTYSGNFYSYLPICFIPQYKFITIKNVILVDELLKFENLDQEWHKLATKLNDFKIKRNSSVGAISYSNIHDKLHPPMNVTASRLNMNVNDFFQKKELKEIVYKLYRKDFELFGYEK